MLIEGYARKAPASQCSSAWRSRTISRASDLRIVLPEITPLVSRRFPPFTPLDVAFRCVCACSCGFLVDAVGGLPRR